MNWLLLDTACPRAVVALSVENQIISKRYLLETKKHSELLLPAVQEILAEAKLNMDDLDGVAVGKGPGSFIGVRVAMAFAKGLCVALDLPLIGVSTLSALGNEPALPEGRGAAVIDARRSEFYVQILMRTQHSSVTQGDPYLMPESRLTDLLSQSDFVVGTSLPEKYFSMDGPSAEGLLAALASRINEIGGVIDETEGLVPDYVRDPDAKPMPS